MDTPSHLGTSGRAFYSEIVTAYELDIQELQILIAASEQLDTIAQCRNRIRREGLLVTTRPHLNQVANPAIAVQRQAQRVLSTLIRQLNLPTDNPPPKHGGIRRPRGNGRVATAKAATNGAA